MADLPDPLLLARIQFGANISFHILFPTITIALGWVLLWLRLRADRPDGAGHAQAYALWVKVFALTFALGVVSGVVMSFQFGTNWPGFMNTVGDVAGPLLAYEVLTAFFLEATFLGVMLYGAGRVTRRAQLVATFLVALGTTMSAFWILALSSWMHTPAGFEMVDGKARVLDWWAVVFNPSFPYRLAHMLLASGLTVAFLLAGLSAWRWLRGDRTDGARVGLRLGLRLAAVLIPLQILAGDLHGLNTLEHQPAKVAAMEGLWTTQRGAPLVLFGIPDEAARETRFEVAIPGLASLILTHSLDGELRGLDDFAEHPPVAPVFWAFRVMVGVGFAMLAVAWAGAWATRGGREPPRWLLRALVAMTFSGWVAVLAGWYVTEIGRQPWLVQGVLTTAQAVADTPAPMLAGTLTMYLALYAGLAAAYVSVLFRLARKAGAGVAPMPVASPVVARAMAPSAAPTASSTPSGA